MKYKVFRTEVYPYDFVFREWDALKQFHLDIYKATIKEVPYKPSWNKWYAKEAKSSNEKDSADQVDKEDSDEAKKAKKTIDDARSD